MKLTQKKLEKYNFPFTTSKPDWDDVQNTYELPNGIILSTLTVCNNTPCKIDSLEGYDGYLYISTIEELEEILSMTFEEVMNKIKDENDEFEIDEYI